MGDDPAFTCPRCGNVVFELFRPRTPLTIADIVDAPAGFHPLLMFPDQQGNVLMARCVDGCDFQAAATEIEMFPAQQQTYPNV